MENPGFNAITEEQDQQQRQVKTPSDDIATPNTEQIRNQGK